MDSPLNLKKEAIGLISKYFGHCTAEQYSAFYADKPDAVVLSSVKELLVEYLGEEKAGKEMDWLKSNSNKYEN